MKNIPEEFHDLLKDETKAFLFLATSMSDGSPQVTPIWFNHDEDHILINSAKGRVKDINMRSRPQVAFVIQDPANPYRYLQIRGLVAEITETGADAHIDALALKYQGLQSYPYRAAGEVRVTYKILPNKIDAH
ncbi:MAG: PPOX class F420-dependent oxidoreductase [Anaerolineales bacterium]|jgi:PPOX class probable F420-dependent enzyme|nr:PPOX class F420-dependent oxidoreductase [Anaerolineales bacterium]